MNIKNVEKKMQLDHTLLVCGQDTLTKFDEIRLTKQDDNHLIHHMTQLGIPKAKYWINRKQVKTDIKSGKIHDNSEADSPNDVGANDVKESKKFLKDSDNLYFMLSKDGGNDPYYDLDDGVWAEPIYDVSIFDIDPDPKSFEISDDDSVIVGYYAKYLDDLKHTYKNLSVKKHILQKTNNLSDYTHRLKVSKAYYEKQAKEAKEKANRVTSSVNKQLNVIKDMK